MSKELIITLVALGITIVSALATIIIALVRGGMKKFIVEKMEEAEKLDMAGCQKLQYVLQAVKEKYKVVELVLNVKKFIEEIIKISKQINAK